MDKVMAFGNGLLQQIETFEKENNVIIDVVYWGIGFKKDYVPDGKIIWGDPNRRDVSIEYHDANNDDWDNKRRKT